MPAPSATRQMFYLIVRGDASKPRIASFKLRPKLRPDEVAFKLGITYPPGWQSIVDATIEVAMPLPPAALAVTQEKL